MNCQFQFTVFKFYGGLIHFLNFLELPKLGNHAKLVLAGKTNLKKKTTLIYFD